MLNLGPYIKLKSVTACVGQVINYSSSSPLLCPTTNQASCDDNIRNGLQAKRQKCNCSKTVRKPQDLVLTEMNSERGPDYTRLQKFTNKLSEREEAMQLVFCCCLVAKLCLTLCDPWTGAHQTPPFLGFPIQKQLEQHVKILFSFKETRAP